MVPHRGLLHDGADFFLPTARCHLEGAALARISPSRPTVFSLVGRPTLPLLGSGEAVSRY